MVTPALPGSWMKPSSRTEGQKLEQRQKPTLHRPQDPKFKNPFGSINQDMLCNSKCWCMWACVGDTKSRSWTKNKSHILVKDRDAQPRCVSLHVVPNYVTGLNIFTITFSFQKLFKHTLFCFLVPEFLFILGICGFVLF